MIYDGIKFIAITAILLGAFLMIAGTTVALLVLAWPLGIIFGMMTGGGLIFVIATLLEDVFF